MQTLLDGLFGLLDFLGSPRVAGAVILVTALWALTRRVRRFSSRRRATHRELLERLKGDTGAFAIFAVRDAALSIALLAYGAFLVYYVVTFGGTLQASQRDLVPALLIAVFFLAAAVAGPLCLFFGIVRFLNLHTLAHDLIKARAEEGS